ncbi:hypothetical protein [Heliophilum fasciatum]|uniref:ATP-grasp domain-containing protein n=1 Tax=Heliophilum fasciatum TaxID=35700 RepID=A0A4V2SX23_9FIRM|nr:hypothetical protein [Heliophilum fasciatum]MCW2277914.1 hypothetical protein [Heliophilum fasciatum]TCP64516.1 hypothetical protein EDD73_10957 [Heliophilum fasciatum]
MLTVLTVAGIIIMIIGIGLILKEQSEKHLDGEELGNWQQRQKEAQRLQNDLDLLMRTLSRRSEEAIEKLRVQIEQGRQLTSQLEVERAYIAEMSQDISAKRKELLLHAQAIAPTPTVVAEAFVASPSEASVMVTEPSTAEAPVMVEEYEAPAAEAPTMVEEYEAPAAEAPAMVEEYEAPAVEAPAIVEEYEAPAVEAPAIVEEYEAPAAEAPAMVEEYEAPAAEAPAMVEEYEAPAAEAPAIVEENEAPAAEAPAMVEENEAPAAEAPAMVEEYEAPAAEAPAIVEEYEAPAAEAPAMVEEYEAPAAEVPAMVEEYEAPAAEVPAMVEENEAPAAEAPAIVEEYDAPGVETPVLKDKVVSINDYATLLEAPSEVEAPESGLISYPLRQYAQIQELTKPQKPERNLAQLFPPEKGDPRLWPREERYEKVGPLYLLGVSDEEIAEFLNLGKDEVKLIRQLRRQE